MANYPYSSPPPPPSPCHNTTSPPPPPPPPPCNHTTATAPPSPSPTPAPPQSPPACACNTPPPSPPPSYHSPPLASPSPPPPPPPPSTHHSPPVHSPPPPTPSYPPPPSQSPPAAPTPPPSSSPSYFPKTPSHSPWTAPPPHYNSLPPNYYDSISPAPAPHFRPSDNGPRTVIVTTFVSLGGVFFLAFIVGGLISMAMKKKRVPSIPTMSRMEQPGSQAQTHTFGSIPAGTSTAHSAIEIGDPSLDSKSVENPKVQQLAALPDQGAGQIVEQASHQTSNPDVADKMSSDTEFSKPSGGEQSVTNMDAPQGADEGNLDKSKTKLLEDQSPAGNTDTSPNLEEGSNEVEDQPNDSNKKLRMPKKKKLSGNGANKGNQKLFGVNQVINFASISEDAQQCQDEDNDDEEEEVEEESEEKPTVDKQEAEERDEKSLTDQTEAGNKDSSQNVEERPVEDESNSSKQKLRLPKKKTSQRTGAKKGKKELFGVSQVASVVSDFESQQSQDEDNDEEQESEEQPTVDKEGAQERDDKTLSDQTEADNKDSDRTEEERLVRDESNDSKQKPRFPKKNTSQRTGAKKGKKPGVCQVTSAAGNFMAQQSEDDDVVDDELEGESEPLYDDEELVASASKSTDENVVQSGTDEQDADPRQIMEEESNEIGEGSNDSKKNLSLSNKKTPSSSGAKKGNKKPYGVRQGLNPLGIYDPELVENSEVGENDARPEEDKEPYEPVPQETNENVEQPVADEQEADKQDDEPLSETNDRNSGQTMEEGSNEATEESKGSINKLTLPKKKQSPSSGASKGNKKPSSSNAAKKPSGISQYMSFASVFGAAGVEKSQDEDNNEEQYESAPQDNEEPHESEPYDEYDAGGGSKNTNENVEVEPESNEDGAESYECEHKSVENQSENDNGGATQDVEQESTTVQEKSNQPNYNLLGNQSETTNTDGIEGADKADPVGFKTRSFPPKTEKAASSRRRHPRGKIEQSNSGQSVHVLGDFYSEVAQSQEDANDQIESEESEFVRDGEDASTGMVSWDHAEGKVKLSDSFSSTRGSEQAFNKAMDVEAKVHELKSGGSSKDSQGRQHHPQVGKAKKPLNLGKIGAAASDNDPGKALVSFDNEVGRVQESELFASNVDYLGQLQTSAQGIEQSSNIFQNLTDTIGDDPAEELKSLGDSNYKGKKTGELKLRKDSRRIKGQIFGTQTGIVPPNLVTAKIGDDLFMGMESLGGNQGEGSDKDGTRKDAPGSGQASRGTQHLFNLAQDWAATNESDPNAESEILEEEKELETEYADEDLSLQEPSAGEMEPSTDDQSVFVTDDNDPDVLQFLANEYDEGSAESNKEAPPGRKPPSRPRTTNFRGKRRA